MPIRSITQQQFAQLFTRDVLLKRTHDTELSMLISQTKTPALVSHMWYKIQSCDNVELHPHAITIFTLYKCESKYLLHPLYQCQTLDTLGFIFELCDMDNAKCITLIKMLDRIDYICQTNIDLILATKTAIIYLIDTWITQLSELWLDLKQQNLTDMCHSDQIWLRQGNICLTPFTFYTTSIAPTTLLCRLGKFREKFAAPLIEFPSRHRLPTIATLNTHYRCMRQREVAINDVHITNSPVLIKKLGQHLISKPYLTQSDITDLFKPVYGLSTIFQTLLSTHQYNIFNILVQRITDNDVEQINPTDITNVFVYIFENEYSYDQNTIRKYYTTLCSPELLGATQNNITKIVRYLEYFGQFVLKLTCN